MTEDLVEKIIQALKDQQDIFGDDLFEKEFLSKYPIQNFEENNVNETREEMSTVTETTKEEFMNAKNLDELNKMICNCLKCPLGKTRNKFVFGVGNPKADIMLIGEGPGADEDMQGEPFVGRAGKLLNDILKAINFTREEVYIANIVKCRPPGNRNPLPAEMESCIPYLVKQIELIKPKIILCLGLVSASAVLKTALSMSKMRGNVYQPALPGNKLDNIKVMVTYHPAALLRNPNWKKDCWEDVQKFRKIYDEIK